MTTPDLLTRVGAPPNSILEGVDVIVARALGVANVRHRSALLRLAPFDGRALVDAVFATIDSNYRKSNATANKDRSRENWRWFVPQPNIAAHNASPEVVIERAIVAAGLRLGRQDWSNQIPVSSGLIPSSRDGRRAVDLVRRRGDHHFEFIELKVMSDTPLYAAIEVILYGCLWLIARNDRPSRPSVLLDANHVDLRVLAPHAFYAPSGLDALERALDDGIRHLGQRHAIGLSFRFSILDDKIRATDIPADSALFDLLDHTPSPTKGITT